MSIFITIDTNLCKWLDGQLKLKQVPALPYRISHHKEHWHLNLSKEEELTAALGFIQGLTWKGPSSSFILILPADSNQKDIKQLALLKTPYRIFYPKLQLNAIIPPIILDESISASIISSYYEVALKFTDTDLVRMLKIEPSPNSCKIFSRYIAQIELDTECIGLQRQEHPLFRKIVSKYHLSTTQSHQLKDLLQRLHTSNIDVDHHLILSQKKPDFIFNHLNSLLQNSTC